MAYLFYICVMQKYSISPCPNEDFLESFAAIIAGSRWQCLASPLSLTSEGIGHRQRSRADQTSTCHAKVDSQGDGNFGQLRKRTL